MFVKKTKSKKYPLYKFVIYVIGFICMGWMKKGDQATQPIYCKLFDEKYISLEDKINTSGVFSYTFNFKIFLCITQAFPNQKNNKIRRKLVRRGTKYYYLRFMNRTRNFYTNRGPGHWLFFEKK